jgi:hypothetical protein
VTYISCWCSAAEAALRALTLQARLGDTVELECSTSLLGCPTEQTTNFQGTLYCMRTTQAQLANGMMLLPLDCLDLARTLPWLCPDMKPYQQEHAGST